ncbi:type II toxin-antitoxin system VapC family toxin [Brucella sp. IR073]|uniref:type II toxin-antitoxin system VapC family toxin n=1 Tax=unclassified Brucella TaxID=2632610 RepID=UPI003B986B61
MRLVDTSAWIEWLIDSPTGKIIAQHLPERAEWLVPTIVQLELTKWAVRALGDDKADAIIASTQVRLIAPLDTEIALAAAEACRTHGLATADAIIFATARVYGADLITCDAHFKGLPGVQLIEKIKPLN